MKGLFNTRRNSFANIFVPASCILHNKQEKKVILMVVNGSLQISVNLFLSFTEHTNVDRKSYNAFVCLRLTLGVRVSRLWPRK